MPAPGIPIVYRPALSRDAGAMPSPGELDSLVMRIREDSIVSYSEYLESLDGRLTMSYGALQARNYLVSKFDEFGYDSVFIDTFTGTGYSGTITGHNVIAIKPGTVNPYHHIIVGAHYDTPWALDSPGVSPGADDNGSGTVAVMEIARALRDVDTRQTFVFILFDVEEERMVGSEGYARRAFANGDRIALMLNMDMIGHYENSDEAYVFWGADSSLAALWAAVADSVPGIGITTTHLESHTWSDDEPFFLFGWHTLGVKEYIHSTVYHSYRDSTVYLNFDYLTRMARANLAAAYAVDLQYEPELELWMAAVAAIPDYIIPGSTMPIDMRIREYGGAQLVPGSIFIHYAINGGTPVAAAMTEIGSDLYRGILPALSCLDAIEYHITADEDSPGTIYYPDSEKPITAYWATGTNDIMVYNFGEDLGWTVTGDATAGHWVRTDDRWGYCYWDAPDGDYDGNGFSYLTGIGAGVDVDRGTTVLTSPAVDVTASTCLLEYARWFSNDYGGYSDGEMLRVDISSNGGATWLPIDSAGPVDQASGGWNLVSFQLEDVISLPAMVHLRFTTVDFGDDSHIEAAVDAVKFVTFKETITIITKSVPNWTAGHDMELLLEAAVCEGASAWVDKFDQLKGTGLALEPDGLLQGVPVASGTILFTAQASGDDGSVDEKGYVFYVNPVLTVGSGAIPTAILGEAYASVIWSAGGTGDKNWSDRDGDLAGTGIALDSDGLLSGTPVVAGDFPFTARVTDEVGATAEKAFTLHIVGPYACGDAVWIIDYVFSGVPAPYPIEAGDADANGTVTVADAVYIINYVFKGGPEPQCP